MPDNKTDAAILDVCEAIQSAVERIVTYGSIPETEAESIVLAAVDIVFGKSTPTPATASDRLDAEIGRAAYNAHSNNANIHSNRFPSWEELTPEVRAEWVWKANR